MPEPRLIRSLRTARRIARELRRLGNDIDTAMMWRARRGQGLDALHPWRLRRRRWGGVRGFCANRLPPCSESATLTLDRMRAWKRTRL